MRNLRTNYTAQECHINKAINQITKFRSSLRALPPSIRKVAELMVDDDEVNY